MASSGDAGGHVALVTLLCHALRVDGAKVAHPADVCMWRQMRGVGVEWDGVGWVWGRGGGGSVRRHYEKRRSP